MVLQSRPIIKTCSTCKLRFATVRMTVGKISRFHPTPVLVQSTCAPVARSRLCGPGSGWRFFIMSTITNFGLGCACRVMPQPCLGSPASLLPSAILEKKIKTPRELFDLSRVNHRPSIPTNPRPTGKIGGAFSFEATPGRAPSSPSILSALALSSGDIVPDDLVNPEPSSQKAHCLSSRRPA